MSIHWNPDQEIARQSGADEPVSPPKAAWPEGATAGLMLVAGFCLLIGGLLYHVAGPRDPIEDSVRR